MTRVQSADFRKNHVKKQTHKQLRLRLFLTRASLTCERTVWLFWPAWSVFFVGSAALMFGVQDHISLLTMQIVVTLGTFSLLWFIISGARKFKIPTPAEARLKLDESAPGRPLTALADDQMIGVQDEASRAVWQAHQKRMEQAAKQVQVPKPDLRISHLDRYGLRYLALLAFVMAGLFGTPWRVAEIAAVAQGRPITIQSGPSWEGWIDPPAYTGLPTLYLNDQQPGPLSFASGSELFLRLYSENSDLTIQQTISQTSPETTPTDAEQRLIAEQDGELEITGVDGAKWQITLVPDTPPTVTLTGPSEVSLSGEMRQPFRATDDYGIISGTAHIKLDLPSLQRLYGLSRDPEPRDPLTLDLPLTISGDRTDFEEILIENLSKHPWAGLPVMLELSVTDAAGQTGRSTPAQMALPGRRFFDPLAKSVVEQRRDLLWTRENAKRISQLLRAATHRPDGFVNDASTYLMLRTAIRQLESALTIAIGDTEQNELADIFWDIALLIEDGDIGDALERLRQAQERLRQAMRDGASDAEIAELMQELRDAVRDYMRQLAENPESTIDEPNSGEMQMLSQQDLQEMMDRIQELLEQGRFAEAEQLMQQLQQMMENLRMTDRPGQSGEGQGQQSMEDLSRALREQQGLSDEAFRQLQEQFNPGSQAGTSGENTGRRGTQGRGQDHDGQGQGATGDETANGHNGRQGRNPEDGDSSGQSLAERQQALRDELRRQEQALPGAGTAEGDAAREALDRAGRAMNDAEDALRDEDYAGALDNQARALEALRDGMRSLSEALAQGQNQPGSQNGEGQATANGSDPLGRNKGTDGGYGSENGVYSSDDVHRRALDLLDKLRERSTDQNRSKKELDYLKRLLDRF